MEGHGGEDVLSTIMAAVSLAADQKAVSRVAQMQAEIDALKIEIEKIRADRDLIIHEKESILEELSGKTEDNGVMEDRIVELESANNELRVKLGLETDDLEKSVCEDPPPTPNSKKAGDNDKLPIPEWRIRYIYDRIATGERPTVCNIMYINMYSNDRRFIGAERFCRKMVEAHKIMCLRFAGKMGIPANPDDIASDIDGVKRSLKDFATLKEHDFITRMFCSS